MAGAHFIGNSLIKAFSAKTLRGEEVRGKTLKEFGVVLFIFLKEGVFLDGTDQLSWLRFELSGVGRLDLEKPDPCLKIQKLILLSGGDAACF